MVNPLNYLAGVDSETPSERFELTGLPAVGFPSYTACLVALARRETDPLGVMLMAQLDGFLDAFACQMERFALEHGDQLDLSDSVFSKHTQLLSQIASPFYNEFYTARAATVDTHLQAWAETSRAEEKRPVILLPGAGFDSKALRRVLPDGFIAEFDTEYTQSLKRKAVRRLLGPAADSRVGVGYFPVNYLQAGDARRQLQEALMQATGYFEAPSVAKCAFFVSLEGLSYYLDHDSNRQLFTELLTELPVGSRCFVDWYHTGWDLNTHPYSQFLTFLGEPVRFCTSDYSQEVLSDLTVDGKRWRELFRQSRGGCAAAMDAALTGVVRPELATDAFGNFTQFSLLEIVSD